jgi:hypothetical protein
VCPRCTTRCEETIDTRTGVAVTRKYTYPEGYLVKGQKILRTEARVVALRAALTALRRRRAS